MSKGFFYITWSSLFLTFFFIRSISTAGVWTFLQLCLLDFRCLFFVSPARNPGFFVLNLARVGNSLSLVPVICESVLEGGQHFFKINFVRIL